MSKCAISPHSRSADKSGTVYEVTTKSPWKMILFSVSLDDYFHMGNKINISSVMFFFQIGSSLLFNITKKHAVIETT